HCTLARRRARMQGQHGDTQLEASIQKGKWPQPRLCDERNGTACRVCLGCRARRLEPRSDTAYTTRQVAVAEFPLRDHEGDAVGVLGGGGPHGEALRPRRTETSFERRLDLGTPHETRRGTPRAPSFETAVGTQTRRKT